MLPNSDEKMLIVLDFDGVVCNSLNECFVAGWMAYYRMDKQQEPHQCGLEHHRFFASARPYVRSAGDFALLHFCFDRNIPINSQIDLDTVSGQVGKSEKYDRYFLECRRYLQENYYSYWVDLHAVFSEIAASLPMAARNQDVLLLSYSDENHHGIQHAADILKHNKVSWPEERIITLGQERKLPLIQRIMDDRGYEKAVLIDDQVDHFRNEAEFPVVCLLAEWGYVLPGWKDSHSTISPAGLHEFMASFV